jgi:GcrA cell cycle regulator
MWTEERIERLRVMRTEGYSCSQIAADLGGVTRNAVIGKISRLGLASREKSPQQQQVRQRKSQGQRLLRKLLAKPSQPQPASLSAAAVAPAPLACEPVKLVDLQSHHCRFPIGDPHDADFAFCGATAIEGLPYCESHCRLAYNPR